MTSVARCVLGLSILLGTAVACGGGSSNNGSDGGTGGTGGGLVPPTGGSSSGGTPSGDGGTPGSGGGGTAAPGVPLPIADGWVDASAAIGIQGAIFSYADPTTLAGPPEMASVDVGAQYCISGVAAKVDTACTITAEDMAAGANDCYGKYWGAAIGLNLNQTIDPATEMGADPAPFDATALKGFSFTISGENVPVGLRFKLDTGGSEEWCTGAETAILSGPNTVTFDKLFKECWQTLASGKRGPVVDAATQAGVVKIAWQLPTNPTGTIPFNFCVSDVVAVTQ